MRRGRWRMRIVLADVRGGQGFVSKDTVAGGFGSRLRPFSKVTRVVAGLKRHFHDLPSVHLAYCAAIARRAGHEVAASAGPLVGGDVAIVLSSRSCPEFCTYCPHRIQAQYRARSVDNILDELQYLQDARGRSHIVFRDPLFSQDRERVWELCDGMRSRGLRHSFECETRLDRLDDMPLDAMYPAGLRAMSFGVESLAPSTLRTVGRRPIPEAHQRAVVARCRELGIVTAAFYVFGFSEDTAESIAATIEYAIDLGSTVAQFKILTPYPGTPLFKRFEPLINDEDWEHFDGFTPVFTHPSLTYADLRFLLGDAYTRFYMRPSFLATYLRISAPRVRRAVSALDSRVERAHARRAVGRLARSTA